MRVGLVRMRVSELYLRYMGIDQRKLHRSKGVAGIEIVRVGGAGACVSAKGVYVFAIFVLIFSDCYKPMVRVCMSRRAFSFLWWRKPESIGGAYASGALPAPMFSALMEVGLVCLLLRGCFPPQVGPGRRRTLQVCAVFTVRHFS